MSQSCPKAVPNDFVELSHQFPPYGIRGKWDNDRLVETLILRFKTISRADAERSKETLSGMKTESLFERLVEISKRAMPAAAAEEDDQPRLKRRDQRSARAKARNAAHRRALARGIPKQSKFAPKRVWRGHGFRTGPQPPPGASVLDRIVRSMQLGCWYARIDLGNLARLTDSERIGVRLFNHGYLMTRRNPDFRRKGVPGSTKLTAGTEQPHHLYTLTPAGEQRRKFLALTEKAASHAASKVEP